MNSQDLNKLIRGWRTVDTWVGYDGKTIGVCLANTHYGRGRTLNAAIKQALAGASKLKERA